MASWREELEMMLARRVKENGPDCPSARDLREQIANLSAPQPTTQQLSVVIGRLRQGTGKPKSK